ncbi:hypothetical protein HZS_6851 [Henneguya salminicola]|nr:hypothetical protein HZS_6851 [Henneguya salminicola]
MNTGYVSEVICRFSQNRQRCKIGKKYSTYWNGSPISIENIVTVDLFHQNIYSKDPYPFNVVH